VRAFRNVGSAPFFIERAEGAKIWDVDGNEYIDYVGSWGPAILGHAPRVVVDAVREAATRGVSFGIPNPLEVEMAELIWRLDAFHRESADGEQRHRSYHVVLRLARGFTARDKITSSTVVTTDMSMRCWSNRAAARSLMGGQTAPAFRKHLSI